MPELSGSSSAVPWATDVAIDGPFGMDQPVEGAVQFIRENRGAISANGRSRPLLAIPLVATGAGGFDSDKGAVARPLLQRILAEVSASGSPDIVVVTNDKKKLAAVQLARRRAYLESQGKAWSALDKEMLHAAKRLAALARQDRLVFFFGAGVSQAAGLPSWKELLKLLWEQPELAEIADTDRPTHPLDQAWLMERRLDASGARLSIGHLVDRVLAPDRSPSLSHYLLASLPVEEMVTTNFDTLFERACENIGEKIAVITEEEPGDGRWLLKLHGSLRKPDQIVLSRSDYLNFSSNRVALAGVVQAMLLTRHMLFVGFSLSDENFLRITHEVSLALGDDRSGKSPAGTVLNFELPAYIDDLWRDQFEIQRIRPDSLKSRGVEIFLDLLVDLLAEPATYLLDESFGSLMSEADAAAARILRDGSERLAAMDLESSPAAEAVREALEGITRS
jgi:hypothetical protein